MDPCTQRWTACYKFLKTPRGKKLVRNRVLNPIYPEDMIKLYLNLDKWSRPRKRKSGRYALVVDYEAGPGEESDQNGTADEDEASTSSATSGTRDQAVQTELSMLNHRCEKGKYERKADVDEEQEVAGEGNTEKKKDN